MCWGRGNFFFNLKFLIKLMKIWIGNFIIILILFLVLTLILSILLGANLNICISLSLVYGKDHNFFQYSHGIKEGDPLSPYLFIIIVEFLSRGLANLFTIHHKFHYPTLGGFPVSHILFADDFIIFFNGSLNMLTILFKFLIQFQKFSGLNIF